jgi:hypothetical protein
MKKILLIVLFTIHFATYAQEFKTPVDYLTYINKEQGLISKSTWKYTSAVAHSKSARRIDNTRKQLVKSIQTAKKKIGDIKNGYKGDTEYQNQVIQYFDFCEKNLNEEYDKIINMQEVAEQSYDAMEAYLLTRDLINEKLDLENEKANNAFKAFALKYNITISDEETALSKKTIEAKSQKDRTKEEIDSFNGMVKQVNKEIDNYNKANTSNFQDKGNATNNWNTVADNFISKHVPVD